MAVLEGRIGNIGDRQPQMPQQQRPNLVQNRNQAILEPEELFEQQPNKVNDIEFENVENNFLPQQALNTAAP